MRVLENCDFEDKWIVVTGAAGFIGSCLLRQLNNLGLDKNILAVDDFGEGEKWKNLSGKKYGEFLSRYELFNWLEQHAQNVHAIIHMGAISSTVGTCGDKYYDLNYRYSIRLAKIATAHRIRFIYASSAATYGLGNKGFDDEAEHLDSLRPLNLYGQSKQMFDLWIYRSSLLDQVVGLKFFNVYGPNEYHKGRMASMIYHMYHQIEKEGRVKLFESTTKELWHGEQKRDFIYVKDVAKVVCDFLYNQVVGIYNLGTGQARSWNEVARILFKVMKKEESIEYIPMPKDLEGKYQNYTAASMGRLQSQMKLPKTSLEDGIHDYVKGYLINEERW